VKTVSGIIHGKTIELNEMPELADGSAVEIVIRPARPHRLPGQGFARTEGALADDAEWDAIMDEVQQARRHERNTQE
jgi:hypothetical protein